MSNETTPNGELNFNVQAKTKNNLTACHDTMDQLEKEGFKVNKHLKTFMDNHRHGFLLKTSNETLALVSVYMCGTLSANSVTLPGCKFKVDTTTRTVVIELRKT